MLCIRRSNYFVAAVVVPTVVVFAVVCGDRGRCSDVCHYAAPADHGSERHGRHVDGECHCAKGSERVFTILVNENS